MDTIKFFKKPRTLQLYLFYQFILNSLTILIHLPKNETKLAGNTNPYNNTTHFPSLKSTI